MTEKYQDRVVRVFISSTFRDMHAEREELVKYTFPELRRRCRERGVEFVDVDLRWGVTQEQSERGEVLPICLAEIERCHPYFIGLLGERYGWVPEEIDQELFDSQPWIKEHKEKSVTELEILHGVLENPKMEKHSFFYFRDPEISRQVETALSKESGYLSESVASKNKQSSLKERIANSDFLQQNYEDVKTLGEQVLGDLWATIDKQFPESEVPSNLEQARLEHEAFAAVRRYVYIGRQKYFDRLDAHVSSDEPPLVLLGESGSGKSALLANWAFNYQKTYPLIPLIQHYIGSSPYSTDWASMIRRIMGELKSYFNIEQEIPDNPIELRGAFANWLHIVSTRGKVVLIIDALNQLEDHDQALDLVWLPSVIPNNVRLIVSTLSGRSLDVITKYNWPTFHIKPLEKKDRKTLIIQYLQQYAKALDLEQTTRIVNVAQSANPLYLRALLEELRIFGKHEELDNYIEYYLKAKTITALYAKILKRYEEDYESSHPGLVHQVMTCLWAARRGLSERELLELLGEEGDPLPVAYLSPLHLAAEESLVSRSGLINFSHDYFRQAICKRYLGDEEKQKAVHMKLAKYFQMNDLDARKIDELPWQLKEAQQWRQLSELLSEQSFFRSAYKASQYDVMAHWAAVEKNSAHRMIEAYANIIEAPEAYPPNLCSSLSQLFHATGYMSKAAILRKTVIEAWGYTHDVIYFRNLIEHASILTDIGDFKAALTLLKDAEKYFRKKKHNKDLAISLVEQVIILCVQKKYDMAMPLILEAEDLTRSLSDKNILATTLHEKAILLIYQGELEKSLAPNQEAEKIFQELGDLRELANSLDNQASVRAKCDDISGAMALNEKAATVFRELGDKPGLALCLFKKVAFLLDKGNVNDAISILKHAEEILDQTDNRVTSYECFMVLVSALMRTEDFELSLKYLKKAELLARELGVKENIIYCLTKQGVISQKQSVFQNAITFYEDAEFLCREIGDKKTLADIMRKRAEILSGDGHYDEALDFLKDAEGIYLKFDSNDVRLLLISTLIEQVTIYSKLGDLSTSLDIYKKLEHNFLVLGNNEGVAFAVGNQAAILGSLRRLEDALLVHKKADLLFKETANNTELLRNLSNMGLTLIELGQSDKALMIFEEQAKVSRNIGDKNWLLDALQNMSQILWNKQAYDEVLLIFIETEQLYRELGDNQTLLQVLENHVKVLVSLDRSDQALPLYQEQELLCRQLNKTNELSSCLVSQAGIYQNQGKINRALELFTEAESLCRELGNKQGLITLLGNHGAILKHKGELDQAISLLLEKDLLCRELGDMEGLSGNLAQRALLICNELNQAKEALPLAEEAYEIAIQNGSAEEIELYKQVVDLVKNKLHK